MADLLERAPVPHEPIEVMVIDDDPTVRELLRLVLEEAGYLVTGPSLPVAALDTLAGGAPPPRVIMLDAFMPVLDGAGFLQAYRRLPGPSAPVIVMSAGSLRCEHAARTAADAVLEKPFDLDEMLALVDRVAHASAAAESGGAAELARGA
jgi:CheY-like chemotaxis protein